MNQYNFDDGKYTIVTDNGKQQALRYGEHWRDLTCDKLISCMLSEIDELREQLKSLESLQTATYTQVVVQDKKIALRDKLLEKTFFVAEKFRARVHNGLAKSVETYDDMTELVVAINKLFKD